MKFGKINWHNVLNTFWAVGISGLFLVTTPFSSFADPGFDRWVNDFWPQAEREGIRAATYNRAFAGLEPDQSVLDAANNQAEFTRAIWDYLDSAASDWRVETGLESRKSVKKALIDIERKWGVNRHILTAIWGLESSYGQILDNPKIVKGVIRSLATLAYKGENRAKFGRTQLIAALKILQTGDTTPDRMTGSWAGAMGHTQFIPTTYLAHAVDYTGDGRRDIWDSPEDALASAANYLAESGWEKGKTWGYEVVLPKGFDFALADGKTRRALNEWTKLGIKRASGGKFPRPTDPARLFLPGGADGPIFLLLKNFDVIKRYNNADAYALAIGHLADRLNGGEKFKATWPRHLKPLNKDQRKELQAKLNNRGFNVGAVDGILGPRSKAAVRKFQNSIGQTPDGFATLELLEKL